MPSSQPPTQVTIEDDDLHFLRGQLARVQYCQEVEDELANLPEAQHRTKLRRLNEIEKLEARVRELLS